MLGLGSRNKAYVRGAGALSTPRLRPCRIANRHSMRSCRQTPFGLPAFRAARQIVTMVLCAPSQAVCHSACQMPAICKMR